MFRIERVPRLVELAPATSAVQTLAKRLIADYAK